MMRRCIEIDENMKDDIEISFHSSEKENIDELKIKASSESMVLTFISYFISECVDLIGVSEEAVREAVDVAFEKDEDDEIEEVKKSENKSGVTIEFKKCNSLEEILEDISKKIKENKEK